MHPILFHFFGFPIPTFGVIVALAFMVSLFWIYQRAKSAGENLDLYMEFAPWLMISAIIGARLFYILFFPQEFFADPLGVLLGQGGLVWYGGMIGVILAALTFTHFKKLNLFHLGDIVAPPAALGLAIGRIGCLMAGCCYGAPCHAPWAIHYPAGHPTFPHAVHPAPLYESGLTVIVALILALIYKRQQFPGQTMSAFMIGYGIVRFVLEYIRGDRLVWLQSLNLSASQIISLCGIIAGIVLWLCLERNHCFNKRIHDN